jgi:hypothetical protein
MRRTGASLAAGALAALAMAFLILAGLLAGEERLERVEAGLAARVERLATAEPDRLRQLVRALSAFLKSASVNP